MHDLLRNHLSVINASLFCASVIYHAETASAEVIILHDGSTIVGPILNMGESDIVIESNEIGRMQIRRTSVKSINGVEIASAKMESQSQESPSSRPDASSSDGSTPNVSSSRIANVIRNMDGQVGFGLSNIRVKSTSSSFSSFNGSSPGTAVHWTVASFRRSNGLTYSGLLDAWQSYGATHRRLFASGIGIGWSTSDTSQTGGGMFTSNLNLAYGHYQAKENNFQATKESRWDNRFYQISRTGTTRIDSTGGLLGVNLGYTHFSSNLLGYFIGGSIYGGRMNTRSIRGSVCENSEPIDVYQSCEVAPLLVVAAATYAGLSYKF